MCLYFSGLRERNRFNRSSNIACIISSFNLSHHQLCLFLTNFYSLIMQCFDEFFEFFNFRNVRKYSIAPHVVSYDIWLELYCGGKLWCWEWASSSVATAAAAKQRARARSTAPRRFIVCANERDFRAERLLGEKDAQSKRRKQALWRDIPTKVYYAAGRWKACRLVYCCGKGAPRKQ